MFWTISFRLLPDENIIDDSTQKQHSGIKSAYSVFLTNKRVIFRFDGLGSSLSQSFFYSDIVDVKPCKRLFINYIQVKTKKREFFLNTSDADYWSNKILSMKESLKESSKALEDVKPSSPEKKKNGLLDMLTILRKHDILSDKELEEKVHLLNSMKF